MDWFEEAKKKREKDPTFGYGKIAKEYGLTYDTVRNRFRRDPDKKEYKAAEESLENSIYRLLVNGKQFDKEYLYNKFKIQPKILSAILECLKDKGLQVYETEYTVELIKIVIPSDNYYQEEWDGERTIKFGVVTDVHTGSKYQQYGHLKKFYDLCEKENVPFVYNCGDIIDGVNMRPGHQFECALVGVDAQVDYVVNNYPSNIPTKFIIGNHCTSAIKSAGVDIGKIISSRRKDMEYLGALNARVEITPNCIVELSHPLSGSCFDSKTEILTKDGWKYFSDLTKLDLVATMTKDNHKFEWQNPTSITKENYEGNMYHFESRTIDMFVTPNHGMWTRENPVQLNRKKILTIPSKSHFRKNINWRRENAEDLYKNYSRQRWQFTNCCEDWEGIKVSDFVEVPYLESKNKGMENRMKHIGKIELKDFCELVAWYVTEGHAREKEVSISQYKSVNHENHTQIINLFKRIGIEAQETDKYIRVGSKELSNFLFSMCGRLSTHVHLPTFIKELPKEYLRIVFDTMIKGDGWINGASFCYRSISPQLRDDFCEIAVKLGYSIHTHKDTVGVSALQKYPTINKKPKIVKYSGTIHCCEVPNGLIFVRRNGKCTWSHNSYAISYKSQRGADAIMGGTKPNILLIGHYHKMEYLFYRNIHILQAGCFQAQTDWMRGKEISAMMGGIIVTMHVSKDGTVNRFQPEFIPEYKFVPDKF